MICCYNSSKRLPKTLEHLANQKTPSQIDWEIVVVDNNSSDGTSKTALMEWERLGAPSGLKVVSELEPGLSFARKKGIHESTGELIVFCDDDNWLNPDYLEGTWGIMDTNKSIGVLGGQAFFQTEQGVIKPNWFDKQQSFFAIGKQGVGTSMVSESRNWVYGAGMVIRRSAYMEAIANFPLEICSDRTGKSLMSGGDTELCYKIKLSGFQIWQSEGLTLKHFMPEERLNIPYLKKIIHSIAISSAISYPYRSRARSYRENQFEQNILIAAFSLFFNRLLALRNWGARSRDEGSVGFIWDKGYSDGVFKNFMEIRRNVKKVDTLIDKLKKQNK